MATKPPNTSLLDAAHQFASDKTPAPLTGLANKVTFAFQNDQPPSLVYIQRDDAIVAQVVTASADTVLVTARLLRTDGQITTIQDTAGPTTPYVMLQKLITLAEGYLLSVTAQSANAGAPGETYVRVVLNRGKFGIFNLNPGYVLISDYVTQAGPIGWPFGRIIKPTDVPGSVRVVTVANPLAGADFSIQPSPFTRWQILYLNAQLLTAVAVANRQVTLQIQDAGSVPCFIGQAQANQVATTTVQYSAASGQINTVLIPTDQSIPLPQPALLNVSQFLKSVTTNIQAADQWSNIRIVVMEWMAAA